MHLEVCKNEVPTTTLFWVLIRLHAWATMTIIFTVIKNQKCIGILYTKWVFISPLTNLDEGAG